MAVYGSVTVRVRLSHVAGIAYDDTRHNSSYTWNAVETHYETAAVEVAVMSGELHPVGLVT